MSPNGPAIFGVDLDQLAPGRAVIVDDKAVGYPMPLSELAPGDYYVQAVIHLYEQVHRADGRTLWVHLNDGTIETWNVAAGNLYSEPQHVHVGGSGTVRIAITFEQQTSYFPDSYSVNSANNGPYGDAIVEEVMPYIEQHFRTTRRSSPSAGP